MHIKYHNKILYVQELVIHFIYTNLLYKMGHYFLDRRYTYWESQRPLFIYILGKSGTLVLYSPWFAGKKIGNAF